MRRRMSIWEISSSPCGKARSPKSRRPGRASPVNRFFGNGAAGCGAKADDFGIDPVAGEVLKFSCRCDGASCKCVVLFNGCFYFSGNSILPRK